MVQKERSHIRQALLDRCETIAHNWHQAIAQQGIAPFGAVQAPRRFVKLTEQFIQLLLAESTDYSQARCIGAALTGLHHPEPEVLSKTQAMLAEQLFQGLSDHQVAPLQPRLAALLGELAAGFFAQAQERLFEGQEQIRTALVGELQKTTAELQKHRHHLEEMVKERTAELSKTNEQLRAEIAERERAEKMLRRRTRDLALLNQANHLFNSSLKLDRMLDTVLTELQDLLDVTATYIWLIDETTGDLICREASAPHKERVLGRRLAPGKEVAGQVLACGKTLSVYGMRADTHTAKPGANQTGPAYRSVLGVPLQFRENPVGVLQLERPSTQHFDVYDVTLVESLAATAAIAIENARLYEQTRRDAETKTAMLQEVNHRVKNNLSAIIGLVYAEQRYAKAEAQALYRSILKDLAGRIKGLAQVHDMLSLAKWTPLRLDELCERVIQAAWQILPRDKCLSLNVTSLPVYVTPKQANDLALIVNELATNSAKHALSGRDAAQVNVDIDLLDEGKTICLEFRDDGPGYPEAALTLASHNVGLYLVKTLVKRGLKGELALRNDGGAITTLWFKYVQSQE